MKKQLKNQEELLNRAFDKYFQSSRNIVWWEYLETPLMIIMITLASMYLSFGNMTIAIILGVTLVICLIEGKPINLRKYLPSDKRRQKEKEEFYNAIWKSVLVGIDDTKKKKKVEELIKKVKSKSQC